MSNSLVEREFPVLEQTLKLRHEIIAVLTDDDLTYALPGSNPTLGVLCRESGQIDVAYTRSFKTFTFSNTYVPVDPAIESSVDALRSWLEQTESDLKAALRALSEDDIQKTVKRPFGFTPPVGVQFHIYRESLLIFAAKAVVYLNATGKTIPPQVAGWIG